MRWWMDFHKNQHQSRGGFRLQTRINKVNPINWVNQINELMAEQELPVREGGLRRVSMGYKKKSTERLLCWILEKIVVKYMLLKVATWFTESSSNAPLLDPRDLST